MDSGIGARRFEIESIFNSQFLILEHGIMNRFLILRNQHSTTRERVWSNEALPQEISSLPSREEDPGKYWILAKLWEHCIHPPPCLERDGMEFQYLGSAPTLPLQIGFHQACKMSSELLDSHFKFCWTMCKQPLYSNWYCIHLKNNLQDWWLHPWTFAAGNALTFVVEEVAWLHLLHHTWNRG